MSEIIYSWKFEDNKDRGALWYTIALSLVLGLAIWGFLTKQYGMSFIVLLISGLVYFVENNSPDEVSVNITELWVKISDSFYDFGNISSYSFIYEWEHAVYLRMHMKKKWLREIDLKLNNEIAAELKNVLPNFLEESNKWTLSFSEKLIHILKL